MKLAMIIGEQRLALEQRMLNRLAVGLMAEGVHVTRMLPAHDRSSALAAGEQRVALSPRIDVHLRSLPWLHRIHVRAALEALEDSPPDVLYLLGRDAWKFGLELARELDRPGILEVWSASQIASLPRPGSAGVRSHVAAITAPCAGIATIVRRRVSEELTWVVPMGVPASPRRQPTPSAEDRGQPSIAVLGSSRDVSAYTAMFTGLQRVMDSGHAPQVFLELRGPHEHEIWRAAERLGIIHAVSAIGSASQHHELLTACDFVLCPERFGDLQSVMLECMAGAMPVIASADSALDMFVNGETAVLIDDPTPRAWEQAMVSVLSNRNFAQELGDRARKRVLEHHQSSHQLKNMLELLHRVVGTDAYPFPVTDE